MLRQTICICDERHNKYIQLTWVGHTISSSMHFKTLTRNNARVRKTNKQQQEKSSIPFGNCRFSRKC